VICYGHFDVQPPDPLELWESGPFEPEIRGEYLYGRGTVDDKGQLYMVLAAARALAQAVRAERAELVLGGGQGATAAGLAGALALPPLALAAGWRAALVAGGALALVSSAVTLLVYRSPAGATSAAAAAWPRLGELRVFLRRPGVLIVFLSGLALSIAQSSVLAHLAIYARDTFALSPVAAGQMLALAQAGGTGSRLAWGAISDRFFGGRRRPGVVVNALIGGGAYALLALGNRLPVEGLVPLALVAGVGAFGWVGLYFALVAEIGGARYAGLLTGVAVAFAWSGVLVGPPIFGLVVDRTGSYTWPWLGLAAVGVAVAAALPRPAPLVQREPRR
jgi:nitrate/nitrite transporter NarK